MLVHDMHNMAVVCVAVISKQVKQQRRFLSVLHALLSSLSPQNCPLFLRTVSPQNETDLQFQYLVHASIDVIEEKGCVPLSVHARPCHSIFPFSLSLSLRSFLAQLQQGCPGPSRELPWAALPFRALQSVSATVVLVVSMAMHVCMVQPVSCSVSRACLPRLALVVQLMPTSLAALTFSVQVWLRH